MLISLVLPIMAIYHLPHDQYGYSGHVLNLPQDVATFVNTLPRCPADLDVIIVRKEGATDRTTFRVRRPVDITVYWPFYLQMVSCQTYKQ